MLVDRMIIGPSAPEQRPAAFDLALGHLPDGVRATRVLNALALLKEGAIQPEGILVANNAAGLQGVIICVLLPGACGLCWLPKTARPDPALEDRLVQAALAWLRSRGARLGQAILGPLDVPFAGSLLRSGFQRVTQLHFFEHPLKMLPPILVPRLRYLPYSDAVREPFEATLLRTYEGTLDCPELNNTRTIAQILAGHRGQGDFHPGAGCSP